VFNSNNSSFSSKIKGIILSKGIRFSRYGNQKARKLSIKLIKDIQQTSTISFKRKINLWTINNPNFHKEKFFKIFSLNSKLNNNNNNNKTYIRISFRNNKIFSNSIVSEISTNGVIWQLLTCHIIIKAIRCISWYSRFRYQRSLKYQTCSTRR